MSESLGNRPISRRWLASHLLAMASNLQALACTHWLLVFVVQRRVFSVLYMNIKEKLNNTSACHTYAHSPPGFGSGKDIHAPATCNHNIVSNIFLLLLVRHLLLVAMHLFLVASLLLGVLQRTGFRIPRHCVNFMRVTPLSSLKHGLDACGESYRIEPKTKETTVKFL